MLLKEKSPLSVFFLSCCYACCDFRYESRTRKKAAKKMMTKKRQAYLERVLINYPVQIFSYLIYSL
jgi:hypothetical protein